MVFLRGCLFVHWRTDSRQTPNVDQCLMNSELSTLDNVTSGHLREGTGGAVPFRLKSLCGSGLWPVGKTKKHNSQTGPVVRHKRATLTRMPCAGSLDELGRNPSLSYHVRPEFLQCLCPYVMRATKTHRANPPFPRGAKRTGLTTCVVIVFACRDRGHWQEHGKVQIGVCSQREAGNEDGTQTC